MRPLITGDTVKLKEDLLGNKEGSPGVVYEEYNIGGHAGVSVIFENGEYDGFSKDEQKLFLERTGHISELSKYKFDNVVLLREDFGNGIFDSAF